MNIAEALDVASLPAPRRAERRNHTPRLDPGLIVREEEQDGRTLFAIYHRGTRSFTRMQPEQWQLAQLLNGQRTYPQIAETFLAASGVRLAAAEVREFVLNLDELGFLQRTAQECNGALATHFDEARAHRRESWTHVALSAFDPDRFLGALDARLGRLIYSRAFAGLALMLVAVELVTFVANWNTIVGDLPVYYNFAAKTAWDLFEFWLLFLVIGFLHETAHGLTCKHYGGEVHSMGFQLLYLTPTFFVDVTESWLTATRPQRMLTILAGIYLETMLGGLACLAWLASGPGTLVHALAYKLMLLTGIAVVVVNLNPLIKLDGYYALTEWLGIPDLKERSTATLREWFEHRWMGKEAPPGTRHLHLFVSYALASTAYSYLLLLFVLRVLYRALAGWSQGAAVLTLVLVAAIFFRARARGAGQLALGVLHSPRWGVRRPLSWVLMLVCVGLLFAPVFRPGVTAPCVFEAAQVDRVNAPSAGVIATVSATEGQQVRPGDVLAQFTPDTGSPGGPAQMTRAGLENPILLRSPMAGVVLTPNAGDLAGRRVTAGTPLLTIAETTTFRVHIYVPERAVAEVPRDGDIEVLPDTSTTPVRATFMGIDLTPRPMPVVFRPDQRLSGTEQPAFYVVEAEAANKHDVLRQGMTGVARIYGRRTSVAAWAWRSLTEVADRLFW